MIFLKSNGIVIFKKDIGEADRYVSIFMEDFGRLSSVIRGIRKSKRRDKVAVDILALTAFSFYKKNNNVIISSFDCIDNYEKIKKDFNKLNKALYLMSVLNQVLFENTKNRKLYNLTIKSLNFLNKSTVEKKDYSLLIYFLYEIIKNEGIISINKKESIENSEILLSGRKYNSKDMEILKNLLMGRIRYIIESGKFEIKDIYRVVEILEDYINSNLGTYINIKKIIWEDTIW